MCLFHRLLDWRERRSSTATQPKTKFDKVVIFRHAFHPKEFEVRLCKIVCVDYICTSDLVARSSAIHVSVCDGFNVLTLFSPTTSHQEDPMLINEIRDDLREECEKFGVVKKVLLFDVREYIVWNLSNQDT